MRSKGCRHERARGHMDKLIENIQNFLSRKESEEDINIRLLFENSIQYRLQNMPKDLGVRREYINKLARYSKGSKLNEKNDDIEGRTKLVIQINGHIHFFLKNYKYKKINK